YAGLRLDRIDLNSHVEWKTVPESEDYDRVRQDTLELQVNNNYTHLEARPQWRSVILRSAESKFIDIRHVASTKLYCTGLLHALALVSLATRLPETKAQAFESGTPVCLRQFHRPGSYKLDVERTAFNCITYWSYIFDQNVVAKVRKQVRNVKHKPESHMDLEATAWSAAQELRQGIFENLNSGTKNDIIGLVKLIRDWRSYLAGLSKNRTHALEVSNLGVMEVKEGSEGEEAAERCGWEVDRAIFIQAAAISGPALTLSVVSVKGKALTMTCCWQVGVVEEDLARGFSEDIGTWLNSLGNTGTFDIGRGEKPSE
ncbi:hypothetical protein NOF04DRAFT_1317678, partial [Fusarium oxysporum II5]